MTYQQHPLSAAFPEMGAEDFQALKNSIESIGVQNPITIFDGMVIDGWHRYRAATELMMDCPSVELADVDPREFVLSQNRARRHITQAQLALAAAAVYRWHPTGVKKDKVRTQCGPTPKTTAEIATAAGVSQRTVEQAKAVTKNAAPEVVEAVKRGEIGLVKAAAISKLPKQEQAAAISKPVDKPEQQSSNDDMGVDLGSLVDELQKENESLHAQLEALSKDDQKAETLKYIKLYENSQRQQSEAMDRAHRAVKREKRLFNLLARCGRAVDEEDPDKIPSAVEAMARTKMVA